MRLGTVPDSCAGRMNEGAGLIQPLEHGRKRSPHFILTFSNVSGALHASQSGRQASGRARSAT